MNCRIFYKLPQSTWILVVLLVMLPKFSIAQSNYQVIDTGQDICYNDSVEISPPNPGEPFYGQDAQYDGMQPAYQDNGDGTVTDLNTGLMWQKTPDFDNKLTWAQALAGADTFILAGHDDWRLPAVKELYSLIDFRGVDPSGYQGTDTSWLTPFIDTYYFDFVYGNFYAGERLIDAQYWSSTKYLGTTMNGNETAFGVNFADGRIKGYPTATGPGGQPFEAFVRYVRAGDNYGVNEYFDNGDGTITDSSTGLMWQKNDSNDSLNWEYALAYAEDLTLAGYSDWRLPNTKELQSIVDYTRSPDSTDSPAIDSVFNCTAITNEAGQIDYPCYWTGTTHTSTSGPGMYFGMFGVYVCFGRAMGYLGPPGQGQWCDVHGAGAQRSDPKHGDPANWPYGHGPQGDAIRIYNYVRCVRGGLVGLDERKIGAPQGRILHYNYPNPFKKTTTLSYSLSKTMLVKIKIYDSSGREVRALVNEIKPTGRYQVSWDGRDDNGKRLSSGVYFCKLQTNENVENLCVIYIS